MQYIRAIFYFVASVLISTSILIICQPGEIKPNIEIKHLKSIDFKIPKTLGQFTNSFEVLTVNNSTFVVYLDFVNRLIIYDLYTSNLVDSIIVYSGAM